MQLLIFILAYPIIWIVSKLPFRLLYLLSDFVYLLVYYVIGYRKKGVRENIAMTLPHLTWEERLNIEKKSYRHLCDMFLEMVKTVSITDKEINERFQFTNIEVLHEMERKNKSIILMCAHYASYEWVISVNKKVDFDGYAVYKKIGNKYFDRLVRDIRSRFKAILISTKETIPTIDYNEKNGKRGIYGLASDQSPMKTKAFHWNKFMGIKVPVHTGGEMLAKKYDMSVVFLKVSKVKRGYYTATLEVLAEEPRNFENYQISDLFLTKVEQQIYEEPAYYLWTHKRWKHRVKE